LKSIFKKMKLQVSSRIRTRLRSWKTSSRSN